MTTSDYLLSFGLLAFILYTNLGTKALTRRRFTVPLIAIAVAASVYLHGIPTAGNDLTFIALAAAAGAAFGALTGLLSRLERTPAGQLITRAGAAFAAVWVVVVSGRILFGYGATHFWNAAVVRFSIHHQITGPAYPAAFVVMALTMVLARLAVIGIQVAALTRRTQPIPAVSA
jgi:hypothetical protein